MFCHQCGQKATQDAAYCAACGTPLASATATTATASPPNATPIPVTKKDWLPLAMVACGAFMYWVYSALPWATDGEAGEESYTLPQFRDALSAYGLDQFVDGLDAIGWVGLFALIATGIVVCGLVVWRLRHRSAGYAALGLAGIGLLLELAVYTATGKSDVNDMLVMGPAATWLAVSLLAAAALGYLTLRDTQADRLTSSPGVPAQAPEQEEPGERQASPHSAMMQLPPEELVASRSEIAEAEFEEEDATSSEDGQEVGGGCSDCETVGGGNGREPIKTAGGKKPSKRTLAVVLGAVLLTAVIGVAATREECARERFAIAATAGWSEVAGPLSGADAQAHLIDEKRCPLGVKFSSELRCPLHGSFAGRGKAPVKCTECSGLGWVGPALIERCPSCGGAGFQ